jgi:ubiquinone/menaquinone biosynthesis C-methylase UbiE
MNIETKRWIEKEGVMFLMGIGVKRGQTILDFGCGEGHYSIPASIIAGENGRIYALDKDKRVLGRLKETASRYNIKNIELIHNKSRIPVNDNAIDIVLCYDIIHYEDTMGRKAIYREAHRVLKKQGVFSVYPKHSKEDHPLYQLALVGMDDIIKEIEESGFVLEYTLLKTLLHDEYVNEGYVLNFRRSSHALD